jgi:T5SS/PEP-CTERM-associated repeat protein/autotransporter-associated beta strand protein
MSRRPVFFCLLIIIALVAAEVPTYGAIILTGNVVPSPPVGDPWNVGGQLSVGETLTGTMSVSAGSDVSNTDGYVGNVAGSSGTVTVSGAGSSWSNDGNLRMGNFGTGALNILAGGTVSVIGAEHHGRIGNDVGGVGIATVDGAGSTLSSENFLLVGRAGNGTLNIQNSGVVSDSIGGVAIFEGSEGTVTITGAGSAWSNVNELQVSDGGNGTLNILNGGAASNSLGYLAVSPLGVGNVTVSGAGSTWTNSSQLQVGYRGNGTLTVENGGAVSGPLGYIGVLSGGTGNVTVSGGGSTWTSSSELQVGYEGSGSLNVRNGATVMSTITNLGTNFGGSGVVTVEGPGSTWTNSGNIAVGNGGNGTLNINNRGRVVAASLSGGNASSGVNFHGGTLQITSTGSLSNTITFVGGGTFDVSTPSTTLTLTSGITGGGGLTKTSAGTLTLTGANAYLGDTRIAAGTLDINQMFLNNAADVYLSPGTLFALNFSGTDVIDSLFINDVSQAVGTYGAVGSGADFESALFAGAGLLQVSSIGVAGDYSEDGVVNAGDYVTWRKIDGSQSGYDIWRRNFERTLGGGAGSAAIPEPTSVIVIMVGLATLIVARPQRYLAPGQ